MEFVRKHKKTSIVILSCLVLFLLVSVTFGKYIYNIIDNYILESKGMYFNSSILDVNTREYKINNWDGVNSYSFTIDLNNRKNSLKKTESDIEYSIAVTCSESVNCSLSKTGGIFYKDADADSYQIVVTPIDSFSEGEEVEILTTVTSSFPYKKEMSAKYTLAVETSKFSYNIEDAPKNNFLILNLTNSVTYYEVETAFTGFAVGDYVSLEEYDALSAENKAKCFSAVVTVEFEPANLQLDMTANSYLNRIANSRKVKKVNNHDYVYSYSFKVPATSSEKVYFYKSNYTLDYTYPGVNSTSAINVSVKLAGETS